ncbi:MAG: hypothetical protein M0O99_04915 [Desulfuromonas thiophila]|jgi:hypothetical protein|nr:hypothetical protein [Desulfuromonas thiophila]
MLHSVDDPKWQHSRIAIDVTQNLMLLKEKNIPVRGDVCSACLVSDVKDSWLELSLEYSGNSCPLCAALRVELPNELSDMAGHNFDIRAVEGMVDRLFQALADNTALCEEMEIVVPRWR